MNKLYITVSEDIRQHDTVDTLLRLWITKEKEIIGDEEKKLINIVEIENNHPPEELRREFLEKYKELPFVGGTGGIYTEQLCFKNIPPTYLLMCVRHYFFGGF